MKFHVTTPRGGMDYVRARITVTSGEGGGGGSVPTVATLDQPNLQNPSRGTLALATPNIPGEMAKLRVCNVSGRLIAKIEGRAGSYGMGR